MGVGGLKTSTYARAKESGPASEAGRLWLKSEFGYEVRRLSYYVKGSGFESHQRETPDMEVKT